MSNADPFRTRGHLARQCLRDAGRRAQKTENDFKNPHVEGDI